METALKSEDVCVLVPYREPMDMSAAVDKATENLLELSKLCF